MLRNCVVWLAMVMLFTGCQAGPQKADVQADRARWSAAVATKAQGDSVALIAEVVVLAIEQGAAPPQQAVEALHREIDAWKAGSLAMRDGLDAWDSKLKVDEAAAGAMTPQQQWQEVLRIYTVAAVQQILGPKLQAASPQAFRLIDRNDDGVLSEQEILAVNPTDQLTAAVVVSLIWQAVQKH